MNLARWQVLKDKQNDILSVFGGDLIFDDLPNNKGCRIETRLLGPRIGNSEEWPAVISWFIDTQDRLRKAVVLAGGVPSVIASPDISDHNLEMIEDPT